jgi:hypothetical protein
MVKGKKKGKANMVKVKKKVRQTLYRPGEHQRVPGG